MKAMILAAGLGTRLRPLTNDRPKALVEIGRRTLLEIALARLRTFGVTDVIVNVHHFADKVVDYLKFHDNFGMHIEISREDDLLLDTGGGLKKAAWFFESGPPSESRDEPFFLHNVDVISSINLNAMLDSHRESGALATLAVQERRSSRQLLFDQSGLLSGRRKGKKIADEIVRSANPLHPSAFCGIHVISLQLVPRITENGVFSIIDTYLRLAASGEKIQSFRADSYSWRDLGKPEEIVQTQEYFADLALRFRSATNPAEIKALGDQLGGLIFKE